MAALRQIAEHCDYKDSLNDMLRDRLVCGVNHQGIQRRLLAEKDLTYARALELAKSLEAAEKGSQAMAADKSMTSNVGIHHSQHTARRKSNPPQIQKSSCYWCGEHHLASTCRFKDQYCRKCNKQGHIAKVCRSANSVKKQQKGQASNQRGGQSSDRAPASNTKVHYSTQDYSPQSQEGDEEYTMFMTRNSTTQPMIVTVHVNGIPIEMEYDTGASLSIISKATHQAITQGTQSAPITECDIKLTTYTGETFPVWGRCTVNAVYEGRIEPAISCGKGDRTQLVG